MLSVVIPAYDEQDNIELCAKRIGEVLCSLTDYELIFVDDGSRDRSWEIISELSKTDYHVKGLHFSKNFGKEGAVFAGLSYAGGDCTAVIDCDLQHPPELLSEMFREWKNGAEIVEAVKTNRGKEGLFHKLFVKSFYRMISSGSGIELENSSDYKLLDRKAVKALLELPERMTFFRALSGWIGFDTVKIPFEVQQRNAGRSKFSFRKLLRYAVSSITSFTNVPMHIITWSGVLFFIFALILGVQTLVNFFMGNSASGFSTVIILLLIIGGLIMLGLGIIGYYLSKIYEEIKHRPRYIVSRTAGDLSKRKENDD